jgi:hypothetical protein
VIQLTAKIRADATPRIRAAIAKVGEKAILSVAGRAVSQHTRRFYQLKNVQEPNRLGGKRTNFWADVARSVSQPTPKGKNQVEIVVAHPDIAQKVLGGAIVPKLAKMLTIPANPIAHGKRAASFNLSFAIVDGRMALVSKDAFRKKFKTQKDHGMGVISEIKQDVRISPGDVIFWLVRKAVQKAWPNSLPAQDRLEYVAWKAADDYAGQVLRTTAT